MTTNRVRIPGLRLLHSPGPTRVPDEVLAAMLRQPTDLADPRVAALIEACESGMKSLLRTERAEVFFYAANGHGGWEAVIANLVGQGTRILVPGTGHFSDGWAEQVVAFGGEALRTPYVEGLPIDPAAVERVLREDSGHRIAAVFVVDVVASLAAAPFEMDALGADVAIGASQKGLMLPPGLAFVAANERALARARDTPVPRFYWDWERRRSPLGYLKFCGTLPITHLAGLEAALALIEVEGLAAVHARHARLARAVHAAVDAWGEGGTLRVFTRAAEARSASVTAIEVGPGIDPEALRSVARERFQVAVAGGLGPLHGRVFRIGHLGDMNEAMLLGCLAGVQAAMQAEGIACGSRGVEAAIASLVDATRGA